MTLHERLAGVVDLTPSELVISRYLEDSFPWVAFVDLRKLSAETGVSMATISRFVRRLGYQDFRDFSRSLRAEVSANFDSPVERVTRSGGEASRDPAKVLDQHFENAERNLRRTLEQIDHAEFVRVAALLADVDRPLYLMSVATGRALLEYFALLAKYERDDIHLLGAPDRVPHDLMNVPSSSVLFATSFDRHARDVLAVLRYFKESGCTTVLVTNRRSSPLLRYVDHPLFIASDAASTTFKTRVSMLVVLEAFVNTTESSDPTVREERVRRIESLFVALGAHLNP